MYFDAVTSANHDTVFFNGTPEETKIWVRKHFLTCEIEKRLVWDGRTLKAFTPAEYLDRK